MQARLPKVPCALIAQSSPPQQRQVDHKHPLRSDGHKGALGVASHTGCPPGRCKIWTGYVNVPLPSYILFYSCEILSVPCEHDDHTFE